MVKRKFLNDADRQRVSETIKRIELTTTGEIVTVIAPQADDYLYVTLFWAAIGALAFPGVLLMTPFNLDYLRLYETQVVLFFVLAIFFNIQVVKMALVPRMIKNVRSRRLAQEQFFQQGLHHTHNRTGVLLFVSLSERYVEIIADKGINDVVGTDIWQNTIDMFVKNVKAGKVADGFVAAITQVGAVLSEHFPINGKNPNEIPDHLIILD